MDEKKPQAHSLRLIMVQVFTLQKGSTNAAYSQTAFAKVIGISQNHSANLENGVRKPSPAVAKKIAAVLDFPEQWYKLLED